MRDLSYAARALRRSAGFTVTAIAVLALGIGSITAIFSVVNKVLLEPLPYPDPDRLVQLVSTSQLGNQNVASIPKYVVWRDNTKVFQDMAAYDAGGAAVNFTQGDLSETLKAARVSADYFRLFGVKMALGRTFSSLEDGPNGPRVAVLNDRLWRRRFARDLNLVGSAILLDQVPHTIIGVLAPGFIMDPPADIWLPSSPTQPHPITSAG
jgi:putative ABC transport system permease protein